MIRKMTLLDLEDVYAIECEAFSDPWDKDFLAKELTENPFARYYVVEEDGKVIGYGGIWVTFDSSQVTNIAVKKEYRHKGYGQNLLDQLINTAENEFCEYLTLEVRVSNQPAIDLYEKNGFLTVNIKKGYYTDNYEDAYYMVKALEVSI